jgi:hypothetical protein
MGYKHYRNQVPLNGITSQPVLMKIYQAVQKILVGDTQTGDFISILSFVEIRLKRKSVKNKFAHFPCINPLSEILEPALVHT